MLSKKAQKLKPSPTLLIAAKARELKAKGHHVISLSVGEPDWDTFSEIKEAAFEAIKSGQTKYAPANGLPQLRTEIAVRTEKQLGIKYSANEVTVSAGAKFILFSALQTLTDPGDEVLIPAPYWVSYPTMVELVDGLPVIVESDESTGFKPLAAQIKAKITPRTKILMLNSPNNPTGQVYTKDELADLATMLRAFPKIVVISDDIYNELIFSGEKLAPHLLHVAPDLRERVIVVNGASKTYSMTGWRLGWALGPEPVIKAMSSYQSQTVSCASPFTQVAALAALQNCDDEVRSKVQVLIKRRDLFVEALNSVPLWKSGYPEGAFYVWADVRSIIGKVWRGERLVTSSDIARVLLDSQMVAVVPGDESGLDGYLRLSFALGESDLLEAVKRIRTFTAELQDK